ncbi:MAG: hypothetical protein WCT02_00715 [Candidatus Paceibacterota bacterium]
MLDINDTKLLDEAKKFYRKIGSIICPALDNERVYFNKHGWNHLIRKGRKFREFQEQNRRILLLSQAIQIIQNTKSVCRHRLTKKAGSVGHFWEIRGFGLLNSEQIKIHVILRRKNDGLLHFFSVF